MKTPLPNDQIDRTMRYVSGEMAVDEQIGFELEMAADERLGALVESCLEMDQLLRDTATARPLPRARPRLLRYWVPLAAAVVALTVLRVLLVSPPPPSGPLVALVSSPNTFGGYFDSTGLPRDWKPPSNRDPRGSDEDEEPKGEALAFLLRAEPLETATIDRAFAAGTSSIEATHFIIPIESEVDFSVIVLALPDSGKAERLFPAEVKDQLPEDVARAARLSAGRHVLPVERLALEDAEDPRVDYRWGFNIRPEARQLELLVLYEPAEFRRGVGELHEHLASWSEGDSAEALLPTLRGFLSEQGRIIRLDVGRP